MRTALVAMAILSVVVASGVVATRLRRSMHVSAEQRRTTDAAEAALQAGILQGLDDARTRATVTSRLDDLHGRGKARVMRVSRGMPCRVGLSDGEIWHCYGGDVEAYHRACERHPDAVAEGRIRLGGPPALGAEVTTTLRADHRHSAGL